MALILNNNVISNQSDLRNFFDLAGILSQPKDFERLVRTMFVAGNCDDAALMKDALKKACAGELKSNHNCPFLAQDNPHRYTADQVMAAVEDARIPEEQTWKVFYLILCAYCFSGKAAELSIMTVKQKEEMRETIRCEFTVAHQTQPLQGNVLEFDSNTETLELKPNCSAYIVPILSARGLQNADGKIHTVKIINSGGGQVNPVLLSFEQDGKAVAAQRLMYHEFIFINVWNGVVVKYLPNISVAGDYCVYRSTSMVASLYGMCASARVRTEFECDADNISSFAAASDGGCIAVAEGKISFMTAAQFAGLRWDSAFLENNRFVDCVLHGQSFALLSEDGRVYSNMADINGTKGVVALTLDSIGAPMAVLCDGSLLPSFGADDEPFVRRIFAARMVECLVDESNVSLESCLGDIREFLVTQRAVWLLPRSRDAAVCYPIQGKVDDRIICNTQAAQQDERK